MAWVFISWDLGNKILYPFLVPITTFTGMLCATNVIGPVTTIVNVIYLINIGTSHSTSIWVIILLRPPQFKNTWSILIRSFPTTITLWVMSWTLLSYQTLMFATLLHIYVCLQMVFIYTINSLLQCICCHNFFSATQILLSTSCNLLMWPVSSELSWILIANLPCSSTLAQIPSSSLPVPQRIVLFLYSYL